MHDIFVDLLSITLIYSVLLHDGVVATIRSSNLRVFAWCGAFHQVVKIYAASTNMLKSQLFLSNIISVLLELGSYVPVCYCLNPSQTEEIKNKLRSNLFGKRNRGNT